MLSLAGRMAGLWGHKPPFDKRPVAYRAGKTAFGQNTGFGCGVACISPIYNTMQ